MLSSTALRTDDTPEEAATVRGEGRMRETRLSETDMAAPSIACQRRRCQLRSRFRPRLLTVFLTTATVFGSTHRDVALSVSESQVLGFGSNYHGQLGVGDRMDRDLPWPLPFGPYSATVVRASATWSFALTSRGALYAWGKDTGALALVADDGEVPQYDKAATQTWDVLTPHQVMSAGSDDVTLVAAGPTHTLLSTRRVLYGVGSNQQGQLGLGDTKNRRAFTRVPLPTVAVSIAAGLQHSILTTVEGTVFVFGSNQYGQLGLDSEEEGTASRAPHSSPRQIIGLRDHFVVQVAA